MRKLASMPNQNFGSLERCEAIYQLIDLVPERSSHTHLQRARFIDQQSYPRRFVIQIVDAKTAQGEIAHFKTELPAEAVDSQATANLIGDQDNMKPAIKRRCDPEDGAPRWRVSDKAFAVDVDGPAGSAETVPGCHSIP